MHDLLSNQVPMTLKIDGSIGLSIKFLVLGKDEDRGHLERVLDFVVEGFLYGTFCQKFFGRLRQSLPVNLSQRLFCHLDPPMVQEVKDLSGNFVLEIWPTRLLKTSFRQLGRLANVIGWDHGCRDKGKQLPRLVQGRVHLVYR